MKQLNQPFLRGFEKLGKKEFGGSLLKGNPREARPISLKRPIHLVMRSSIAIGNRSFLVRSNSKKIETLVRRLGNQLGVKIYRFANSGNHLHILILPRTRMAFNAYIKAVSGLIARMVLGVQRGKPQGLKFWDARPYTRIVEWGSEFTIVATYIIQNKLEALGFIPYLPRKSRIKILDD